jgi:hypothetical protein
MARLFTLEQATRALPGVEKALRDLIKYKGEHDQADAALQAVSRKVMLSGGMQVRGDEVLGFRRQKQDSAELVKAAYEAIQEAGCIVKDLNVGLIDFPSLYRDREVYLCWRLGEPAIEYWHGVDEGFRGRKKIDDDFRANHKGDAPS